MAQKLIEDLDKSKPEVVVEVAIMQVTRDKLRNLGINPPTSVSVSPSAVQRDAEHHERDRHGREIRRTATTGSNTGSITLNTLGNLNATNFSVTIPAATANFLMSDSSSKLIQQPEIRASDGQKASLKIGERVPVATGSFQPGIGGVGINPLVNTQFNYIDVGVNIDITPHVHGLDEVTLKLAMDISAVDSYQNIGGIQQPVIGQRKIENEIRMKEGEVNILGGILEDHEHQVAVRNSRAWPRFRCSSTCSPAKNRRSQRQRDCLHPDSRTSCARRTCRRRTPKRSTSAPRTRFHLRSGDSSRSQQQQPPQGQPGVPRAL